MCTYGYVRVSSKDQNEERQIDAMKRAGLAEDHLFVDKKSGKDFDRPQYKKMMKKLRKGDVLYILSVDRLVRNYKEILHQWYLLTKKKEVYISGTGYAPSGHQKRRGPDGHLYCRHCAADPFFRSPKRKRKYPLPPGPGHSGSQSPGRTVRPA